MTPSICSIRFLDPQPTPGDPDRVWFAVPSSGTGLYAVTRVGCSCPWGTHHPDDVLDHPCKHLLALLHLLDETPDSPEG